MEGVRSPSPEIQNCYFSDMLSNVYLDFISDVRVTDHRHYDRYYTKYNRKSSTKGLLFEKQILSEVSYFARNMYETQIVTSGICYIEDLIFLENKIQFDFEIFWMSRQPIVQWNYNTFTFIVLFLTTFCSSFWKRVRVS